MSVTVIIRTVLALGSFLGLFLATVAVAAPPSGLAVRLTGGGSTATLSWDRPTAPNGAVYVIQRGVTELRCAGDACAGALPAYSEYARLPDPASGATAEYLDAAPVRGKLNCYRVYLAAESPPGEAVLGQCVGVPAPAGEAATLAAPSGLSARADAGFRSILVSWRAAPASPDGYVVERSITGSADGPRQWLKITTIPVRPDPASGTASHDDRFVSEPGWYCYRVRANSVTALGPPSAETCLARPAADASPAVVAIPGPPATGTGQAPGEASGHAWAAVLAALGAALVLMSRRGHRA